jgi:HPt (histidine-containing phosphotransfer) domain-containing protein
MTNSGPTREPEDGQFRRGLFARRDPSPAEPTMTDTDLRLAETLQRAVDDRLEESLRTIEEQATGLMREIATEVWRTSARDVRPEQERIMSLLSRDQAIRSLVASSDERFQALAVRTARLEDHLQEYVASTKVTREAMEASVDAIREIADSPTLHGVEGVRSQLEMVERHIAETFAHIDERDQRLSDTILAQVREHGEQITAQIREQGELAVGETMREIVDAQTTELTGQLDLVREKVGLHGRDQEELRAGIERLIESRVRGLAELVRSDSTALRGLVEQRLAGIAAEGGSVDETAVIGAVDERMAAMERIVAERMATLERSLGEQVLLLSTATSASMERNLERMLSATGSFDGLDELIAETQQAMQERMTTHIDDRITAIARLIRADNKVIADRLDGLETTGADGSSGDTEAMRGAIRSMKELEAGLTAEVMGGVDRRMQSLSDQLHRETQSQAEAMLKVAEMLGEKIDRLTVRVDEGMGNDVQIVVDRMSDAIRAMSMMRREAS